jgi:hypothetical protein
MELAIRQNGIILAIAINFEDFGPLHRFARVCRQYLRVVLENLQEIYAAHATASEIMRCVGPSRLRHVYGHLHSHDGAPSEVRSNGTQLWHRRGLFHSYNDQPSEIVPATPRAVLTLYNYNDPPIQMQRTHLYAWHTDGKQHRDNDKPAEVRPGVSQEWYQHGQLHRGGDKPARVDDGGSLFWYQHGLLHRDDDKPAVMMADGTRRWCIRGARYVPAIPALDNMPRDIVCKILQNFVSFGDWAGFAGTCSRLAGMARAYGPEVFAERTEVIRCVVHGTVTATTFRVYGVLHRADDRPAMTLARLSPDGSSQREACYWARRGVTYDPTH